MKIKRFYYIENGKQFEVVPDDVGWGLYLDSELVEDYGSEELAVKVMKDVSLLIDSGVDYICMSDVHEKLEV